MNVLSSDGGEVATGGEPLAKELHGNKEDGVSVLRGKNGRIKVLKYLSVFSPLWSSKELVTLPIKFHARTIAPSCGQVMTLQHAPLNSFIKNKCSLNIYSVKATPFHFNMYPIIATHNSSICLCCNTIIFLHSSYI